MVSFSIRMLCKKTPLHRLPDMCSLPLELILTLLPGSVFEPLSNVQSASLDTVLKLLALAATVLQQFLVVVNLLLGDTDGDLLTLLGFAKNLLGRDLHGRGILVLDLINCVSKMKRKWR